MVALDSSSMIAFLSGAIGSDTAAVEEALRLRQAVFPPVVVVELLSDPAIRVEIALLIRTIPSLEIHEGYWERAGELRRSVLRRGLKAPLADSLIAQSCIDHKLALVTRDNDFRHFTAHSALRLQ